MSTITAYRGQILYTSVPQKFETLERGYVVVEDGRVKEVLSSLEEKYRDAEIVDLGDKLLVPSFMDLHIHAPQYAYNGLGMDEELVGWLDKYAFPEEARFADPHYARKLYSRVIHDLWKNGSTRAVIFGSLHKEATKILMDLLIDSGMGGFVGKVNMNRNSPDFLIETTEQSLADTEEIAREYAGRSDMVKPCITPRFIPSCTLDLMEGLGDIAARYDLPVQTHLSEAVAEVEWSRQLHPEFSSDGALYDHCGLFGQTPTVMAHCLFCPDDEVKMMSERGIYAVHCPYANLNVSGGMMPIRELLDAGVPVGLGSDIAGGHVFSLSNVMSIAVCISKMVWHQSGKKYRPLTTSEAFYLGTKSGGALFGKVGSFEPGYEFDALVIDDSELGDNGRSLEERLQRYIYTGDDRQIVERYVRGKRIEEPRIIE
jgi:guanine deaminase